jgi:diguanylate cyclase (GGDEF)-like protein/PAS domain S-box-containing protein
VVVPCRDGDRLLGYIELGVECEDVVKEVKEGYGVESCVLIRKAYLSRKDWESGMRMLGRTSRWDDLDDWVLTASSLGEAPNDIDTCPEEGRVATTGALRRIALADRPYLADCMPLQDVRGREVGKILFLYNVMASDGRAQAHVALAGLAGLVVGGFIAAYFLILGRAQRQLALSCQRLAEESRAKEEAQRRLAEESAKAHSQLQIAIDVIADPFMVIDRNFRLVLANQMVREKAGTDPVAQGLRCHQVSHHRDTPCDSADDPCPLREVVKTKLPVRVTHTHYDAQGHARIIDIVASPILNESGEVVSMIESCRDVTDRKLAEEELHKANRRLKELATTDELTGLWNRRWFVGMLEREVQRRRRKGTGLALVMVDIDHFKATNDTYGHAFGDVVLARTARTLKAEARATDIVARYGGEEFVILMPDTTQSEALVAAERIRQKVAEHSVAIGSQAVTVTVSAGVSTGEGVADLTPDILMRLADEGLYEAKRTGRNRTCSVDSSCPLPARS